jgi:hypothetical protein
MSAGEKFGGELRKLPIIPKSEVTRVVLALVEASEGKHGGAMEAGVDVAFGNAVRRFIDDLVADPEARAGLLKIAEVIPAESWVEIRVAMRKFLGVEGP